MTISATNTQSLVARAVAVQLARKDMTRGALAEALGVGPMWVSSRMNGSVNFDTVDIDRIAEALGLESGFALLALAELEASA